MEQHLTSINQGPDTEGSVRVMEEMATLRGRAEPRPQQPKVVLFHANVMTIDTSHSSHDDGMLTRGNVTLNGGVLVGQAGRGMGLVQTREEGGGAVVCLCMRVLMIAIA